MTCMQSTQPTDAPTAVPQEHSHAPPAPQAPLRAGTGETQEHQAATEVPGAGYHLHTQLRQVGPGTTLSVALTRGLTAANPGSASLIPKPGPLASLLPLLLALRMLAFDLRLKLQLLQHSGLCPRGQRSLVLHTEHVPW